MNLHEHVSAHNLFGQHGLRCPRCSGLGNILVPGSNGHVTKLASRCLCKGTGLDIEAMQRAQIETLMVKMERLEQEFLRWKDPKISSRTKRSQGKMSRQFWEELIAWATADGTAVANTTTEAIIMPNIILPANYMQDGRALRMKAFGKLSTTGTPTMRWSIRWNGVGGTVLAMTEDIAMGSGVSNVNWSLEALIQTRLNGSSGSLLVMGELKVHTAAGTVLQNVFGVSGYDAPAAVTVDLTADTPLSLTADWSAADALNTLTGMMYTLESMN